MSAWAPNRNATHMANNLLKWWRTKFLNGYKLFQVDCEEARVSDTEALLGRTSPEYSTSCTTPPLQNQTSPSHSPSFNINQPNSQNEASPQLNLQEFSCDVSVEGAGLNKNAQERQEFSFTLYDFDGHGKITKDDIAGLVTTIYEVLGSSVKVPHYGSKTIKVKLTVSPDQRKHVSATVIGHKDNKFDEPNNKAKPPNAVTKSTNPDKTKSQGTSQERKHYCCRKVDEEHENATNVSEENSEICSRISADVTSEDEEGVEPLENRKCKRVHWKRNQQHSKCPNVNLSMKESGQKDGFLRSKKVKKRSSSLQRQELLEIIRSNMDKNHCFQTAGKPCTNHISSENTHVQHSEHKQHRHRHKEVPTAPLSLSDVIDPTHFYVDLASLQNTTQFSQSNCHYDKLVDAVIRVSNKKISPNKNDSCKYKDKLHDAASNPLQCHIIEPQIINLDNINRPSRKQVRKTAESEPTTAVKKNIRKFPQVVLGHTSSPHHLRHRNRQEDQARAMAQVVRWLEQEFSSNIKTKDKEKIKSNCWVGDKAKHSCSEPLNSSSGAERHEHHHIHEHIHHHYHHYQEAPVVV